MVKTKDTLFRWKRGFGMVEILDGQPYVNVWVDDMEYFVPVRKKKSPKSKDGFAYVAYIPLQCGAHNNCSLSVPKACVDCALEEVSA